MNRPWETFWQKKRGDTFLREQSTGHKKHLYEHMAKKVGSGSVLDIGCASGIAYPFFRDIGITDYTGLDVTERFIERARKDYPEAKWIHGVAYDTKLPDKSFDSVVTKATLDHVHPDDVHKCIDEMVRLARKQIIIQFFTKRSEKEPYVFTVKNDNDYDFIQLEYNRDWLFGPIRKHDRYVKEECENLGARFESWTFTLKED